MDDDDDVPFDYKLQLLADAIDDPSLDSPKETNDVDLDNIPRKRRTLNRQNRPSSSTAMPSDDQHHVDETPTKQERGTKRMPESSTSISLQSNDSTTQIPKRGIIVKRQSSKIDLKPCQTLPPGNVIALIEDMGGSDVKLVTRKKIQATDLKMNRAWLSIPQSELMMSDFLNEQEKRLVQKDRVKVCLVDPRLDLIKHSSLQKWYVGNSFIYALCYNWKLIVKRNNLMQGEVIQVWSFRVNGKLWFALVRETGLPVEAARGTS